MIALKVTVIVLVLSLLVLISHAEDYAVCIDQNTECQTDCCSRYGGHFSPDNEIDCQDFEGDYMALCGQPCQDDYERCMGYGDGGSGYVPGESSPNGYEPSSSGSCCGGAFILGFAAFGLLFVARK